MNLLLPLLLIFTSFSMNLYGQFLAEVDLNKKPAPKHPVVWLTDFEKAKKQAQQENKPMLLCFSASDWCHWCKRLAKEIIDTAEFQDRVCENFIFVKLDFPKKLKQSKEIQKQNDHLLELYHVEGFPVLLVVDSSGKEIARTSYKWLAPKDYAEQLIALSKTKK